MLCNNTSHVYEREREREREREQIILVNYQFLALLTEIYLDVIHRSRLTFQIVVDPTRSKKKKCILYLFFVAQSFLTLYPPIDIPSVVFLFFLTFFFFRCCAKIREVDISLFLYTASTSFFSTKVSIFFFFHTILIHMIYYLLYSSLCIPTKKKHTSLRAFSNSRVLRVVHITRKNITQSFLFVPVFFFLCVMLYNIV